jgi:hypothetical protein
MSDSIGRFVGDGHVLNGDAVVAAVHYEVRVRRNFIEDSHGLVPSGLLGVECILSELPDSVRGCDRLTLVMDDGRKLNFYALGDGTVKATGGIYS